MDGIVYRNIFASYTHILASGAPGWAKSFVSVASQKTRSGKLQHFKQETSHGGKSWLKDEDSQMPVFGMEIEVGSQVAKLLVQ
jgi:hypothetical protein